MTNKMWLGTELYTGSFGEKYNFEKFSEQIQYALDLGIDKIDTAECYGLSPSVEELLGKTLKNKRDSIKISTKFGHLYDSGVKKENFSLNAVEFQLERSLERLKTDYLDIYYFHSGNNGDFFRDELWEFLNRKKKEGKIRSLGLSLKHSLVIEKDHKQILYCKNYGIDTIQTVLNFASRASLDFVIPFCKKNKLKIITRMPLAKGLLSGKYKVGHKFFQNDDRSNSPEINNNILSHNINSPEKAINWVKQNVSEIIIGSKNFNQIKSNFRLINKN